MNENITTIREACIKANPEIKKNCYGIACDKDVATGVCHCPPRPIRLADVLLAIGREKWEAREDGFEEVSNLERLMHRWDLRHDDLTQQSPETLTFLAELLK